MDTIFALATPPGRAGLAVVRVSGPQARETCRRLAGRVPEARRASLCLLRDPAGSVLDEALVLVFDPGASFTGEAVVEYQLHGSLAVVRAVMAALASMAGVRPAEAGEFTRRALENGRLNLPQVEALSDLIEAETEAQRLQALTGLSGALGERVERWRGALVRAMALMEAVIDFADEEVPEDVSDEVRALLIDVTGEIAQELRGVPAAERVRTGFEVAIVGPPNAGKSTLLNRLAGRDAAITSEIAGTTRDVIEVRMEISGLAVTLLDTAGVRETSDSVERLGVARARERAERADLRVHLVPPEDRPVLEVRKGDIVLVSKDDAGARRDGISALTGHGVDALLQDLGRTLAERVAGAGLGSRERHRIALTEGLEALETALERLAGGPDLYELTAEETRIALRRLEALIGRVDVEDILGQIFSSFCVGK